MHWWSEEEKKYLRRNYPNHSRRKLLEMFNKKFNLSISLKQLEGALKRYNMNCGRSGQFEKGHSAWNKGMKGINLGGKATQFKKGYTPVNYRPVGSERINVDGYVEMKIADPRKWRLKHQVVWEQVNGPIPKGHVVIFGDGNRLNLNPDNLILISRMQLVRLNQNNLISDNLESTKTGIIIADIYSKISERKKASK